MSETTTPEETSIPIYVTDTHALIWLMNGSARLGENAAAVFAAVDRGEAFLIVPAVVLAELVFMVERGRVDVNLEETLQRLYIHPAIERWYNEFCVKKGSPVS